MKTTIDLTQFDFNSRIFNQGNSITSTSYNRSHTNAKC